MKFCIYCPEYIYQRVYYKCFLSHLNYASTLFCENSCFCENSNAGKRNSRNFTYLRQLLQGFTEINNSDHKHAKHWFNMLAELNKYGFQSHLCQSSTEAQRRRQGHRSVVTKDDEYFEQLLN